MSTTAPQGPISKKMHAAAAELCAALDALDPAHPARAHVERAASELLNAASRIKSWPARAH